MSEFPSEDFGTAPNVSAGFGKVPQDAETFRIVQNDSERKSDHMLTVREVARMFEAAGVARTERSITNWCQQNKTGIARLDAFYDLNVRKYFITPQSVEAAIQEELSKERGRTVEKVSEPDVGEKTISKNFAAGDTADRGEMERLRDEVIDLRILNQGKDQFIKLLKNEREEFKDERKEYIAALIESNRRLGELETRLGIEPPTRGIEAFGDADSLDSPAAA